MPKGIYIRKKRKFFTRKKKQFCPKGHDTFVTGKYPSGGCIKCKIEDKRKDPTKDSRFRQFCSKGHDTFICGRNKKHVCKDCVQEYEQKRKEEYVHHPLVKKQFCIRGHDISIVGRTNRRCNECKKEDYLNSLDKPHEQFCIHGHDTFVIGRTKSGNCKKCNVRRHIERRKTDVIFRLICNLRRRLLFAIKNNQKKGSAIRDLGCSIPFLKDYLQSKFYGGITWDNYGKFWEIDHIKEFWEFDITDPVQFKQAVHYTNLQPLTIPDHRKKTFKKASERSKLKLK